MDLQALTDTPENYRFKVITMAQITSSCNDQRIQQLKIWLDTILTSDYYDFALAAADGSARRYFRIHYENTSYIVMDAPPQHYDVFPVIAIGAALADLGLNVPQVFAQELEQGFLLINDFGTQSYLTELQRSNNNRVDDLYNDAFAALLRLQLGGDPDTTLLPPYDRAFVLRELEIFHNWYLQRHLGLDLSASEEAILANAFEQLALNALQQPQVWMHRDYHSRNLMMVTDRNPGILDFQDAVIGPVTYDLVSLLRDCYITWPQSRVQQWTLHYRQQLLAAGFSGIADADLFMRWFDLMGLQRHLKAVGIFARLNLRDKKPGYLQDIPRTLGYIRQVLADYPEFMALQQLLSRRMPEISK